MYRFFEVALYYIGATRRVKINTTSDENNSMYFDTNENESFMMNEKEKFT